MMLMSTMWLVSRIPLPLPLLKRDKEEEDLKEDAVFEKGGEDAIYVPFSHVKSAKLSIDTLMDTNSRKHVLSSLKGKVPPVVISLCIKILSEKRKDSHTKSHPVLETYHDFITYTTLHEIIRKLADARAKAVDLKLPTKIDDCTEESANHPAANDAVGFDILSHMDENQINRAVIKIKVKDHESITEIQNMLRSGNILLVIDISGLEDMKSIKHMMKPVKHTAKACGSRLIVLDNKTILGVGKGFKFKK
jgi:SepF-like predicted cell division protein (DUF552 family)